MQKYLRVLQGAEYLGMSQKALRKWLERGRIPYRKLGRRVLIPAQELERFLATLPGKTVDEAVAAVEEDIGVDEEGFLDVGAAEHGPCTVAS